MYAPRPSESTSKTDGEAFGVLPPQLGLPKGGGALRGIGDKVSVNPATGSGSMAIPVALSPGRSGFGPQLSLSYDSGAGNGPFGVGWSLSLPSISRRTDKGVPRYNDVEASDTFILSGADDLVPVLVQSGGHWIRQPDASPAAQPGYRIQAYRPRSEGLFSRIERWTENRSGISHWRSIARDNTLSIYGRTAESRIADPANPRRVFSWLICASYDDKGNAIHYRYKLEDDKQISCSAPYERNRLAGAGFAQRYLKSIRYSNRQPLQRGADLDAVSDWLFEAVLDYGEHEAERPTPTETQTWPSRSDPFSTSRATFEVRTYRLCRRILMFHHMPDVMGGVTDSLVRSTEFDYNETPVASYLTAATQSGCSRQQDGSYLRKSLPRLTFDYSRVEVDETVHEVDGTNLPEGVEGKLYQWIDLDSEGLAGVLTEQGGAWYYKRNQGAGKFGPVEVVSRVPIPAALWAGRRQLQDLGGEGHLSLASFEGAMAGYSERTEDGDWQPFKRFKSMPAIEIRNDNLRFVDLTGDGHSDILISEDAVFTWYRSLAKDGFARANCEAKAWDEEKGPRMVFAEAQQSVFLADMSGDGLSDIVRIRHDEICYWPNLGYGRWGAKVAMGNAPVLDRLDQFDPKRVHLADIDGSGNTDIVYVGSKGVSLYFNQSGNSWSNGRKLSRFPRTDDMKAIAVTDLLGSGTACLVWSSSLLGDARQPLRYIDLMGGQKPHLLISVANNMGAQTELQYASSTKFYLEDRRHGRPWVTRLPFPVHVVERRETRDLVSDTKLVSTYRYRHGYFDGVEREFRGFAFVEQHDAETVESQFDLPPVLTKTWFHTGAFPDKANLEGYFKRPGANEYFTGDPRATFLPDTVLPSDLPFEEMREAARGLKGLILRQEIYAEDGSPRADLPYGISERSYRLRQLQPRGPNQHAVFFVHPSESIEYHYERDVSDPRISHALTLVVDDYGNVLEFVAIGYPRRGPAFDAQRHLAATLTQSQYTNAVLEEANYRVPVVADVRTYELTSPKLSQADPLDLATLADIASAAIEIDYEVEPTPGQTQKRLIERVRSLYRKNDLTTLLPTGKLESLALPGESYKMALTPGLLDVFQARASRTELIATLTAPAAGYCQLGGGPALWIPSGRTFLSPGIGESAAQERAFARANFYLPHRYQDQFGTSTTVAYDQYSLLPVQTQDAAGNRMVAEYDYRVLQPRLITDPNGNRSEARYDALGMLVGTAVSGKAGASVKGDSFDDFKVDLDPAETSAFFKADDPRALAVDYLGTATTRIIYDIERDSVCTASIARETHVSDMRQGQQTKVQLHFVYFDGFGREAQTKAQAEPGPLNPNDPSSPVANPRWAGSGTKVFNNKGKPVRQFEPFFSADPKFHVESWGVSSTLFYDPVERVIVTLHPNHTYQKVVFGPWRQTTWDVNDTVLLDPKTDPDVGKHLSRLPDEDYLPTWYQERLDPALDKGEQEAAAKAAKHANTPTIAHLDTLGRPFLTIADNGRDSSGAPLKFRTRAVLDIEGNQRTVIDALDRVVMRYDYDMLGTRIHQASMEAGERWILGDAAGKPLRAWNSRKYAFRTEYDALHRPVRSFVQGGDAAETNPYFVAQEILVERTIYGDSPETGLSDQQMRQANLRGKVFKHFDGAGVVATERYDFKGNTLSTSRQIVSDYKMAPDWSNSPLLDVEKFTSETTYDALNRPVSVTSPDGSVYRPTFNEASLLEKVAVNLRGAAQPTSFVNNIDYDSRGQRTLIEYGNGAATAYEYDPETFRLKRLTTTRRRAPSTRGGLLGVLGLAGSDIASRIFANADTVQDIRYVYDPVGNVTLIHDQALRTTFNSGQRVEPTCDYTYDPLYRLIRATGREHTGQSAFELDPTGGNYRDYPFVGAAQQGDLQSLRNYTEEYHYDPVGNFEKMRRAIGGGWTRRYTYDEPSQLEPARKSNRLSQTALQASPATPVEPYRYDAHGNMTEMPHLPVMSWDFKDQLAASSRQVVNTGTPKTTYYTYNASGERARKVTERRDGTRESERLYLGGFEVYREFRNNGSSVSLARETLQVMDDKHRIALVETQTVRNNNPVTSPVSVQRYQLANHLGSTCLEFDEALKLITYEEYSPYGSTTFQAGRSAAEASTKRYRYTGNERDEETGLAYHSARYYCPWLGRWTAADPISIKDNVNQYAYAHNRPIILRDPSGRYGEPGHYYTMYFVSLASGFDPETSLRNATYAQMPDEVNVLDAIRQQGRRVFALSERSRAVAERDLVQKGLHALTGGSSEHEREVTAKALSQSTPGSIEFGFLLHRLGDTYAHSVMGSENRMYETGLGHARHFHSPDQIQDRPDLYKKYVSDTFDALSAIAKRSGRHPRLSKEQVSSAASEIASIRIERTVFLFDENNRAYEYQLLDVGATEKAQISAIRRISERLMSGNMYHDNFVGPLSASQAAAPPVGRLAGYSPENDDTMGTSEYLRPDASTADRPEFVKSLDWSSIQAAVYSASRKVGQYERTIYPLRAH